MQNNFYNLNANTSAYHSSATNPAYRGPGAAAGQFSQIIDKQTTELKSTLKNPQLADTGHVGVDYPPAVDGEIRKPKTVSIY
jgi:hypothetical protein